MRSSMAPSAWSLYVALRTSRDHSGVSARLMRYMAYDGSVAVFYKHPPTRYQGLFNGLA